MKLSVLALDCDGTIARDDVVDSSVREAIAAARASGITVLLTPVPLLAVPPPRSVSAAHEPAPSERIGVVVIHLRKGPGLFGSRAGSVAYHVLRHAGAGTARPYRRTAAEALTPGEGLETACAWESL